MKIIHIAQNYRDGWGYHENLLPQYQFRKGHEVTIITSQYRDYKKYKKGQSVSPITYYENGVKIIRLPLIWEFKGRFVVLRDLLKTIEKEKPDYIFHHGITTPSLITAANYKKKNPKVFLAADNHSDLNISGRYLLWRIFYYQICWKLAIKKILKHVDLIFGVTPARCLFPEKYLGISKDKIRLLPIGADVDSVYHIKKHTKKIISEKINIVTGGKWTKDKELDVLVNAVKNLDIQLVIFGQLVDRDLKQIIDTINNVHFVGWQDRNETFELLSNADLAVWTKRHTTLIEDAVAAETPLLLRYHGSTSHFIRGNGVYLFTGTMLEIRQAVKCFVDNPLLLKNMKQSANKMKKFLSYESIANESIEYYYNRSPNVIHNAFMHDILCDSNNPGFEKIV